MASSHSSLELSTSGDNAYVAGAETASSRTAESAQVVPHSPSLEEELGKLIDDDQTQSRPQNAPSTPVIPLTPEAPFKLPEFNFRKPAIRRRKDSPITEESLRRSPAVKDRTPLNREESPFRRQRTDAPSEVSGSTSSWIPVLVASGTVPPWSGSEDKRLVATPAGNGMPPQNTPSVERPLQESISVEEHERQLKKSAEEIGARLSEAVESERAKRKEAEEKTKQTQDSVAGQLNLQQEMFSEHLRATFDQYRLNQIEMERKMASMSDNYSREQKEYLERIQKAKDEEIRALTYQHQNERDAFQTQLDQLRRELTSSIYSKSGEYHEFTNKLQPWRGA